MFITFVLKKVIFNFITFLELFFPEAGGFTVEFFYKFLVGQKRVSNLIIVQLLTLKDHCTVTLPNYKICDELQKETLYSYCKQSDIISQYIPDDDNCDTMERDLLIQVSILVINQFIYALDKQKWKKLYQINTEISLFKSKGINSEYGLHLNENVIQKLKNYEPLPSNRKHRTRLNRVKTSEILSEINNLGNNIDVNNLSSRKKQHLKEVIRNKNLS